jgi:hypothetical protein
VIIAGIKAVAANWQQAASRLGMSAADQKIYASAFTG